MEGMLKYISWLGTLLAAVAAAVWSFLTYEDKTRIEFQKPLVAKTLDLCLEISRTVGDLVSEPNPDKWYVLRARFWSLYHGELVLIEEPNLAGAMVKFNNRMMEWGPNNRVGMEALALGVSQACRSQLDRLMDEGWKLNTSVLNLQATEIKALQRDSK